MSRPGETRAHPALVEVRAQQVLLARLIVALRVPMGDQEETGHHLGRSVAASGVCTGWSPRREAP
jgi:hypothetical protein